MKPDRSLIPHLVIREASLPPGGEWSAQVPGWSFLQVAQGAGYWMHPRLTRDLTTGSVVILSAQAQGYFRASQLGGVCLRFFRLEPERLAALASVSEQNFFQEAAVREDFALRLLSPESAVAERFKNIRENRNGGSLCTRLQLVQLFLEAIGAEFGGEIAEPAPELDAKQRLANLVKQMPAAEWTEVAFPELAERMHCTPRHLSRIFHELVGMSFREKQTELRLNLARELLERTQSKVVDVALESGYQSQSLFNLLFKRRFGVSPARWRLEHAARGNWRQKRVRLLAA